MVENEEKDDRWSGFIDEAGSSSLGTKKDKEPAPTLSEYIPKVIQQRSPRKRQEKTYKLAARIVRLVTGVAHAIDSEWKTYITGDNTKGVKVAPLRTLSEDRFECMVPLIRPVRLDGFRVVQKPPDELPQHRCLIQVNPALSKEEATLVHNEWTPYINKQGFLRPTSILKWFNSGLSKACPVVLKDHHNIDMLVCIPADDGTAMLNITATEYDGNQLDMSVFTVNIYPGYILDAIPPNLKLTAPLPCFGAYIQGQKRFRDSVITDIRNGKQVAFLDPKADTSKQTKPRRRKGEPSWKLNLSFTEYHVYSLIDKYCRGLNFRHVLILMNILREHNKPSLDLVDNEILVNTLFSVSQKHIDKLNSEQDWFLKLCQNLCDGLKAGHLPSFYLPRQNLLAHLDDSDPAIKTAYDALKQIVDLVKANPRNIYNLTGFEEKKKGRESDDENGSGRDDEDDDVEDELVVSEDGGDDYGELEEMVSMKDEVEDDYDDRVNVDGADVDNEGY